MFPFTINIVLAKGAFSIVLFSQMLDMRGEFLAITAFGSPKVDDCNCILLDEVLIVFISNLCYTHVRITYLVYLLNMYNTYYNISIPLEETSTHYS